ncbi:MGMT family protein [Falsiroseomonas oryziterrae]|uniref:MGMT family protein n=1 Tax=Falsiroseomonas oryziterrae TaxID=2911368 RepID=UPI001F01B0E9|nr:MGMT family protein [Roseomonas sp. NPKOSM-4]
MPSPFFARIKGDVLAIVASVPAGRVVTYAAIGAHLDVMPRHVAYILAQLPGIEKATLPWHRAVAADGRLGVPKAGADGESQRALLATEGAAFDPDGRISDFVARQVEVAALPHGVPRQTRPADAPVTPSRQARRPAR